MTARLISLEAYRRHRWYEIGAQQPPFPQAYYGASQDGPDCRLAYTAGIMARLFGVDLSAVQQ